MVNGTTPHAQNDRNPPYEEELRKEFFFRKWAPDLVKLAKKTMRCFLKSH
jgi:hypothetical protein